MSDFSGYASEGRRLNGCEEFGKRRISLSDFSGYASEGRRLRMTFTFRDPPRVCLERSVELDGGRLRLRDWPGICGPLVHVPDPLWVDDALVDALAARFAPRYRVLSLQPRPAQPYQVQLADLRATLDQFGFGAPVLVGERLGCVAALLLAAWYPDSVARLVLLDQTCPIPPGDESCVEARALTDCPPDRARLRLAVRCPVLELNDAAQAQDLDAFLQLP